MINYSNATFFCIFLNLSVDRIPKKQFNTLRCQAVANNDNASIAQSVEQGIENPRVGGSIPPRGTISSLVQSVERWTVNPYVAGSSPAGGAKLRKAAKEIQRLFAIFFLEHKSFLRLKRKLLSIRINSVSSHLFSLSSFLYFH